MFLELPCQWPSCGASLFRLQLCLLPLPDNITGHPITAEAAFDQGLIEHKLDISGKIDRIIIFVLIGVTGDEDVSGLASQLANCKGSDKVSKRKSSITGKCSAGQKMKLSFGIIVILRRVLV